jgi:hypothetical protein
MVPSFSAVFPFSLHLPHAEACWSARTAGFAVVELCCAGSWLRVPLWADVPCTAPLFCLREVLPPCPPLQLEAPTASEHHLHHWQWHPPTDILNPVCVLRPPLLLLLHYHSVLHHCTRTGSAPYRRLPSTAIHCYRRLTNLPPLSLPPSVNLPFYAPSPSIHRSHLLRRRAIAPPFCIPVAIVLLPAAGHS